MSNLIENNAYRILGLDTNASQKDVLKRYKEIINRLKIDDFPVYDLDIELPQKLRTEDSVNEAFKKLQNQKSNIKEYFFWFSISDKIDEKALNYLQNKDIEKAMQTWMTASKDTTSTAYFYKKNLAILCCLMLFKKSNASYLKATLDFWKEIIDSDKFWVAFAKKYAVSNEQTISSEIVSWFKKDVKNNISDVYSDLYHKYKDSDYLKKVKEVFGAQGQKTEKTVLLPELDSIYEDIENLKKFKFEEEQDTDENRKVCDKCGATSSNIFSLAGWTSFWLCDDGTTLCNKCKVNSNKSGKKIDDLSVHEKKWRKKLKGVYDIIISIEKKLDKLQKTGLYDEAQTKTVRDHIAEGIRYVAVSLYNRAFLHEDSVKLTKIAQKICGTDSLKNKLESDIQAINKIVKDDKKNSLTLDLHNGSPITFKSNLLEYGKKKIAYSDIEQVSYLATAHSINGIPTGTTYQFNLASVDDGISLSVNEDEWGKLIGLSKQLIEPIIVQKIIEKIFEKNTIYTIGEVSLDKEGYSRDKFFGGVDKVLWSDTIFIPQLHAGQVILFKEKKGKGKQFAAIKMDEPNAVVLPELLQECVNAFQAYNQG